MKKKYCITLEKKYHLSTNVLSEVLIDLLQLRLVYYQFLSILKLLVHFVLDVAVYVS